MVVRIMVSSFLGSERGLNALRLEVLRAVAGYDTARDLIGNNPAARHGRPRTLTVWIYLGFFAIPLGVPARPSASADFNSVASSESSARLASRAASSTLPFFRNFSVALL